METVFIQTIILLVIFICSLAFSMLPLKFISIMHHTTDPIRRRKYKRCLSLLSCFGGGVFLAACLLDLYPDVQENLTNAFEHLNFSTKFPLIELVISVGFFTVFIIEQIVLSFKEHHILHQSNEHEPLLIQNNHSSYGSQPDGMLSSNQSATSYTSNQSATSYTSNQSATSYTVNNVEDNQDHSMVISIHEDPNSHSSLRTLILLLAISLHSVFEGLALGLQTNLSHLWQLLSAVAIHKCIISLSLGMNLVQTKFKVRTILIFSFIFSVATPLGIGIGMGVINMDQTKQTILISGLLQGLACGTFLYVTFFEILPHEINNGSDRLLKVLIILMGFSTISIAIYFGLEERK